MDELEILNQIHNSCECLAFDYISIGFEFLFKLEVVWILLAVILIKIKRTRIIGITLLTAIILEMIFVYSVKALVGRPRPFAEYVIDGITLSVSSGSFPSGHTAGAFCAATVIALFDRYKGIWMYLLAFFIAFSRMYLEVHFPTDVLAGAIIGIACAFAAFFICLRKKTTVFVNVDESD